MKTNAAQIARSLNDQRAAFKAFLVARVGNAAEAEDILQNGLLKALRSADTIADADKSVAWFYQLLRNAVIDHYRSRGAAKRRDDDIGTMLHALGEDIAAAPPGWEAQVCACLGSVVDSLKPRYAELLRRVELDGEPVRQPRKLSAFRRATRASRCTARATSCAKSSARSAARAPTTPVSTAIARPREKKATPRKIQRSGSSASESPNK